MSKLVCKNCKSTSVEYEDYCGGTSYYRCTTCGKRGNKDKFSQQTVFHRLTQSPEVLAETLVYNTICVAVNRVTYSCWKSTITDESYRTKEEAIAATVNELKEVYNG